MANQYTDHFTDGNSLQPCDGRLRTPFNMIVSGPTGAGKSTLVSQILTSEADIIDKDFDWVYVFIGTPISQNSMAIDLNRKFGKRCRVYADVFNNMEPAEFKPFLLEQLAEVEEGSNGLLIFDDLMSEVSESGILVPLFTKMSSHQKISNIFITQNIFYKGKKGVEAITVYRNAHYIALFNSPLDKTTIDNVARKINPSKFRNIALMISDVCAKFRYIFIDGRSALMFRTQITGLLNGIHYQRLIEPL